MKSDVFKNTKICRKQLLLRNLNMHTLFYSLYLALYLFFLIAVKKLLFSKVLHKDHYVDYSRAVILKVGSVATLPGDP